MCIFTKTSAGRYRLLDHGILEQIHYSQVGMEESAHQIEPVADIAINPSSRWVSQSFPVGVFIIKFRPPLLLASLGKLKPSSTLQACLHSCLRLLLSLLLTGGRLWPFRSRSLLSNPSPTSRALLGNSLERSHNSAEGGRNRAVCPKKQRNLLCMTAQCRTATEKATPSLTRRQMS